MRKEISVFVSAILVVILSGCSSSNVISYGNDSENIAAYNNVIAPSLAPALASEQGKSVCQSLRSMVVSSGKLNQLSKQVAYLSKVELGSDRNALSFVSNTSWASAMDEGLKLPVEGDSKLVDVSSDYLNPILTSIASKFSTDDGKVIKSDDISLFVSDYLPQAFNDWRHSYCNVDFSANDKYNTYIDQFNAKLDNVNAMANSVPWYPDGYNEWSGDSNVAWKWVSQDCYLGDYCWHIKVVSAVACNSLYAEINIEDSYGTVVDWTNDTAGYLSPGSSVILEFSTYNDSASGATGRLTQLDCNSY